MSTNIYPLKKVSTLAGTGKTETVIENAARLAQRGELVIIAVPSIDKVREIENILKNLYLKPDSAFSIKPIHSKESCFSKAISVADRIAEATDELFFSKMEFNRGGIVICTHEGFLISNNIQKKSHWHLYWDEAHTVFHHITGVMLKEFKQVYLDDLITLTEHETHTTGEVCSSKVNDIRERLKSNSIGIRDSRDTRTLTGHLLSASQGYCDIILNKNHRDSKDLDVVFLYNANPFIGFKTTTILGALLEETNLYKWFTKMGVEFIPDPAFSTIEKTAHSEKLTVYYANATQRHTRAFMDKEFNGKSVRNYFREAVLDLINTSNDAVLVMANKDNHHNTESSHYRFEEEGTRFIRCPWNNEGLNGFGGINKLLYIGTFNPTTQYHNLISNYEMVDFGAHYHLYQTLMRTSIRNGKESSVFLPCLSLFEPLKKYFSNVEFIPLDVPEEIMNWRDQRSFIKENDGRIKTISLDDEWYIVSKTNMKKCRIPYQKNNQGYIKWFECRGYKPHTIVSKKQKRKYLIVYQFPDAIEKAQVILDR